MNRIRLSVKLTISFLSVAVIVLVVGLAGIHGEWQMREDIVEIGQVRLPSIIHLNHMNLERMRIRTQTLEVQTKSQWSLQVGDQLKQLSAQRAASWTRVDEALSRYEGLPQTPEEAEIFKTFKIEYATWRSLYRQQDDLIRRMIEAPGQDAFDPQAVYAPLYQEFLKILVEIMPVSDRVGALIDSMMEINAQIANDAVAEALDETTQTVTVTGIGMGLGLLLAIFLGLFMTRDTLRRLGGEPDDAVALVNRVAAGDLTTRIELRQGDTTSLLAAFARMVGNIQALLREVSMASAQVAAAAVELSATSEETREQVRLEQAETDQVATAINEMTATVEEVARHAADAARAARDTDHEANAGQQVVAASIQAIDALASEVESAGQVIGRLSEDSEQIGAVLDVIRGVAEQTNLLALNAAIEAARAGEQGRGFAVVAAEVRTLASRTQASIQDIQEKIERVQSGSAGAVQVMETGRIKAQEGVVQARRAGESLQAINSAIGRINDMNNQIASAAEEQSAVAEEINRNIHTISIAVERTAAGSTQIAAASERLADLATQLQERVAQFTI